MYELWAVFGCVLLFGVPALMIWWAVHTSGRLRRLEQNVAEIHDRQIVTSTSTSTPTVSRQPARPKAAEPQAPKAEAQKVEAQAAVPRPPVPAAPAVPIAPREAPSPPAREPVVEVRSTPPPARASVAMAAQKLSLEARLWTQLPVWIGAIAIALAAAYLVKYSFDRGWISPTVRVSAGVALGIGCLLFGERLRRSDDNVARGLSAAGIACLFVAFFAAVNLYQLMSVPVGFLMMALTTGLAVVLSLRQGVLVAVLGLVGGFATPAMVGGGDHPPAVLFSYLLLLQSALVVVSRKRRWWALALITQGFGLLWVLAFASPGFDSLWPGLFVVVSVLMLALSVVGRGQQTWGDSQITSGLGWTALVAGMVVMSTLGVLGGFATREWLLLGLLAAGALVLARLDEAFHRLGWLSFVIVFIMLGGWLVRLPAEASQRFLLTLAAFALLFAGGAWWSLWRRQGATSIGSWGAMCAASPILALLIAAHQENRLGLADVHWGWPSFGVAVTLLLAAMPLASRRAGRPELTAAFAALAIGVTSASTLAIAFELERQWLSVVLAVEIPVVMWLAQRLRLSALRRCAWLLAVAAGVRLLLNPEIFDYPIGTTPIFNWLLYGYGVPLAATLIAVVQAQRQGDRRLSQGLQWLASGLVFALVTMQVRQYFHPGDLARGDISTTEWGTYIIGWLALAVGGLRFMYRWPTRPLSWTTRLLTGLAMAMTAAQLWVLANPLWNGDAVGTGTIFNRLLWIYGVPALALLAVARELRARDGYGDRLLALAARIASLGSVFWLITLQARQIFHGSVLKGGDVSHAENYCYSFAWLALGSALVIAGIVRQSQMLRYASLALLVPAVFKIFLLDTQHLEGLYRVFSLFGLGVSLFVLAYLYRRFVFSAGSTS